MHEYGRPDAEITPNYTQSERRIGRVWDREREHQSYLAIYELRMRSHIKGIHQFSIDIARQFERAAHQFS